MQIHFYDQPPMLVMEPSAHHIDIDKNIEVHDNRIYDGDRLLARLIDGRWVYVYNNGLQSAATFSVTA